jgi:hypothetical protein
MVERKARVHDQGDSAMGRNHPGQRINASDYSHSKHGDCGYFRAREANKQHLVTFKSFMMGVVEKLDGCTKLCTSCGSHDDVLHSPPSKEAHFSSKLQALQVTTEVEDGKEFAFRGSFPNDGTFPVSDDELHAGYHSMDDESDNSSIRLFPSPEALGQYTVIQSERGFVQEYFARFTEEKDMSCATKSFGTTSPRRSSR